MSDDYCDMTEDELLMGEEDAAMAANAKALEFRHVQPIMDAMALALQFRYKRDCDFWEEYSD